MNIVGLQKTTLVDYPGKVATTLFTLGCNMRCPYCHNKQIAFDFATSEPIKIDKIYSFLEERKNFIDGVVISGGEPTLQKDLIDFIKSLKERFGFCIKLDTNGSKPHVVKKIIKQKLVDYFALDIKTSFNKYKEYLGIDGELIFNTYKLIRGSGINYELRMTCYPDYINSGNISEIMSFLSPKDRIYIQKCNLDDDLIDEINITYKDGQLELFEDLLVDNGFASTLVRNT